MARKEITTMVKFNQQVHQISRKNADKITYKEIAKRQMKDYKVIFLTLAHACMKRQVPMLYLIYLRNEATPTRPSPALKPTPTTYSDI